MLRVGFLLSPPLVVLVADHVSLRAGLLGAVLAGLLVVVLGRVLPGRRAPAAAVSGLSRRCRRGPR